MLAKKSDKSMSAIGNMCIHFTKETTLCFFVYSSLLCGTQSHPIQFLFDIMGSPKKTIEPTRRISILRNKSMNQQSQCLCRKNKAESNSTSYADVKNRDVTKASSNDPELVQKPHNYCQHLQCLQRNSNESTAKLMFFGAEGSDRPR